MAARVLFVDDEPQVLELIRRILRNEQFEVVTAANGARALDAVTEGDVDIVVTDLSMPGMSGIELLAELRNRGAQMPTIVMSGAGTVTDAVEAVKLGAQDFIEKPLKAERLLVTLNACQKMVRLETARRELQAQAAGDPLIGVAPVMRQLKTMIDRIAPSDGRVLILGENGTGKELVAAAIHTGSERAREPYIKLNCSAVPRELIESELFGHEKGAFTGAVTTRRGRFEIADHGTLFLDEVGDMPPEMQVKLLRVLQEGQFERVGGTRTFTVDVRVVAATNRDIERLVADGAFREDLYYRLNVVTLRTPPLRERSEDIPVLSRHFAAVAAARTRRSLDLTSEALALLARHDWPGNVRELQNVIERLAILCVPDEVRASDVEAALGRRGSGRSESDLYRPGVRLADLVADAERTIIEQAIQAHDGNRSAAARGLGLERSHFYKKCKQLSVELDQE